MSLFSELNFTLKLYLLNHVSSLKKFVREADPFAQPHRLVDELTVNRANRGPVQPKKEGETGKRKRDRKSFRNDLVRKLAKEKTSDDNGEFEIDVLRYYYYIQVS